VTFPTYRWGWAPEGLATRRQLALRGLTPGRQPIAAEIVWRYRRRDGVTRPTRLAYLYRTDLAVPKRPATPAQLAALARAMRVRRTCPTCRRDIGYCLPHHWTACLDCQDTADQRHDTEHDDPQTCAAATAA